MTGQKTDPHRDDYDFVVGLSTENLVTSLEKI
jgi:hypothetical protein